MTLELIIALVLTAPIIAIITGLVWYLNLGAVWPAWRRTGRQRRPFAGSSRLGTKGA
jgi:lipopolysaccharide/colanic/teichoic acid biosynthesis glycosyltransferase